MDGLRMALLGKPAPYVDKLLIEGKGAVHHISDGYHQNAKGGEFVTYDRLRAMGTNGFQEPAAAYADGKIVGTKRLFSDGKFNTKDGRAIFKEAAWRGLQAPGKEEQKKKFKFLINNGRTEMPIAAMSSCNRCRVGGAFRYSMIWGSSPLWRIIASVLREVPQAGL